MLKNLFLAGILVSMTSVSARAETTQAYVFRVNQDPNGYFYPILLTQTGPATGSDPATKRVELYTCFFEAASVPRTAARIKAALTTSCRLDERHSHSESASFGHGNWAGFLLYLPSRDWLVWGTNYAGSVGSGEPGGILRIDHSVGQLLISLGSRPAAREIQAGINDQYSYGRESQGLRAVQPTAEGGRDWEFVAKAAFEHAALEKTATLVH